MYTGPEWEMDKRYSTLLAQMFIVLTFSSGMPLLYPIGMFCVITTYWVDKYLFISFYKTPPLYDMQMANAARNALKLSIIIHCMMSIYIYSNEDIFNYDEEDPDSLFADINKDVDYLFRYMSGIKLRKIAAKID